MCITHILNLHIISLSFIHEFRNYKEYDLKINKEIMEQVLEKIRWTQISIIIEVFKKVFCRTMQYSGDVIPDKITISVWLYLLPYKYFIGQIHFLQSF